MASSWLSSFSTADFATKITESVKSIERNFDTLVQSDHGGILGVIGATTGGSSDQELPRSSNSGSRAEAAGKSEALTPDQVEAPSAAPVEGDPIVEREDQEQPQQEQQEQILLVDDVESTGSNATTIDNVADPEAQAESRRSPERSTDEQADRAPEISSRTPEMEPEKEDPQPEAKAEAAAAVVTEKLDAKTMEIALQGAARQAQMKADELSRVLQENDDLRASLDAKEKKFSEELNAMREEYQQRLSSTERKLHAVTKERDVLRREQNRTTDISAKLKEKQDTIDQVMAEGAELSKKQAVQEQTIRKLRAQIRELEAKLQIEEGKVESIKKVLQETVEKSNADLAAQRKIVSEAREAEARAEAKASSQAKADLDKRLQEAAERENEAAEREDALVRTIDELRQSLSRTESQAVAREDQLRKELADRERQLEAAETRYVEVVASVPESTRPLLRQMEAMQESWAMRAEAWSAAERALNSRLQEKESRAEAANEREKAMNERLSQTLSRMAVMEAQVSCTKAEVTQVSRSLEKERLRAAEIRQELLAALETAATHEGRAKQLEQGTKQLEQELFELKEKHSRVLADEMSRRAELEQELDTVQAALSEVEHRVRDEHEGSSQSAADCSGTRSSLRRLPSTSSIDSLDSHERMFRFSEPMSPHRGKIAALEQYEAFVRQKDGEVSSYNARLSEMESIRLSLAEELVKSTTQCEKFRSELAAMAGLRAELEALRRRHASALELMGERDEQVEELRADLADVKQMYRDQINLLVGQIEMLTRSTGGGGGGGAATILAIAS